jgi:hypothetical protein
LVSGLRRFGLFFSLLGGLFTRFRQFSGSLEHVLGCAHLLLRGVGARDGRCCLGVQPLRRSGMVRTRI